MFDIGFAELVLVGVVGLLVIGPERLPGAINQCQNVQCDASFRQSGCLAQQVIHRESGQIDQRKLVPVILKDAPGDRCINAVRF